MLSSFIVFLTILLFTSRLAQRSEIIAVLAGGISFQRLMRPYFMASTLLVVGSLLLSHFILPISNQRKLDFEVEFVHKEFHIAGATPLSRNLSWNHCLFQVGQCWQTGGLPIRSGAVGRSKTCPKSGTASKAKWMEEQSTWRVSEFAQKDLGCVRSRTLGENRSLGHCPADENLGFWPKK